MKFRVTIICLLTTIFFLNSGCRFREEKLIYKNPEQLSGTVMETAYLTRNRVSFITVDNVEQAKKNLPGLQNLNLNQEVALYVSLGEKPTGGYQILITEIKKRNNKLIVQVKASKPKKGQFVTQAIDYPHDIVKLPQVEVENVIEIKFIINYNQEINLKVNQ